MCAATGNGVRDASLDVIVPDMAGNQRLSSKALDAGCYEFFSRGTVITLK